MSPSRYHRRTAWPGWSCSVSWAATPGITRQANGGHNAEGGEPVHRDLASAARAASARLRPFLILIDRFRLPLHSPLAPRLRRFAAHRMEAEPGMTGGPHDSITRAQRVQRGASLTRAAFPPNSGDRVLAGPRGFQTGHSRLPTRPAPGRLARVLRTGGVEQLPAASQRSRAAMPRPGRTLIQKSSALVTPQATAGLKMSTRPAHPIFRGSAAAR